MIKIAKRGNNEMAYKGPGWEIKIASFRAGDRVVYVREHWRSWEGTYTSYRQYLPVNACDRPPEPKELLERGWEDLKPLSEEEGLAAVKAVRRRAEEDLRKDTPCGMLEKVVRFTFF